MLLPCGPLVPKPVNSLLHITFTSLITDERVDAWMNERTGRRQCLYLPVWEILLIGGTMTTIYFSVTLAQFYCYTKSSNLATVYHVANHRAMVWHFELFQCNISITKNHRV